MLDDGARRLLVASVLRLYATRRLGTVVPAGADLAGAARRLAEDVEHLATIYGLSFAPSYPGVGAGVEDVGDSRRLVLACRAADRYGPGAGTAFTTLIPGRPPQVSLAPAGTPIPGGWAWVAPRPGGPIGECG